jgi:hypothetical protein
MKDNRKDLDEYTPWGAGGRNESCFLALLGHESKEMKDFKE